MTVTVINGEKATLETPTFAQKRQRTLDMLIRSLYQDLMPDLHKDPAPPAPRLAGRAAGHAPVHVFDKTLVVKQMHILEPQDLLVTGLTRAGCHLYAINTHHGSELRIVAAIRNKLLLITRKQPRPDGFSAMATATGADSPVEEFQYIREICLCDPPVVMALVDGPTGENDNMICRDHINIRRSYSYDLGDHPAGGPSIWDSCYYKKVCPFNGSAPMIQSNTSDFHFSWNQIPNAIVCAFPYILAFTTDSIEIRLVVNGNLVYTAVVPELQLTASRSDIYFVSSAPVNSASNCSSRDTSSQSSPQTPTGYEMPVFPSPLSDDSIRIPYGTKLSLYMSKDMEDRPPLPVESACKHISKIPLSSLVGRTHREAPQVPAASTMCGSPPHISASHSLSLSRMEIKEIASRTRKELLVISLAKHLRDVCDALLVALFDRPGLTEEPSGKPDSGAVKHRRMSRKNIQEEEEPKPHALTSSPDADPDAADHQHRLPSSSSSSAEPGPALPEECPLLAAAFTLSNSFGDVLDLK
ncbi:hypothetical protein CRUP_023097 [Coryphaenoides rupestris]|nr:hypothetical protein CRUP_023097 [Coryphaenoides rupestris]